MKWRQVAIVALLFVLVFSLAGCDLFTQVVSQVVSQATTGSEDSLTPTAKVGEGTAQPTVKATAKPSGNATAAPTDDSSGELIDQDSLQTLEDLDSYHQVQIGSFTTVHTDTTITTSTINIEIWETKDPLARHVIYTGGQTGSPDSTFEIIVIGQDSYMKSSDTPEWFAMSTSTTDTTSFGGFSWFTDPTTVMQGDAQLIGVETVNGMASKHYRYQGASIFSMAIGVGGTVEVSQADIWISNEFNLVIKYISQFKGTDVDGVQSDHNYTTEVLEVNTPIEIEAPEGVAKAGLPDDVPMMDGATDVNAFAGIVSFKVSATASDVMDFYALALVNNGWTAGEETGVPEIANYTKDTRTLTLMASEDNGSSSVTIIIQEQ